MGSAGQHKATVVLDGKADGLTKAGRKSSQVIGKLEDKVEQLEGSLKKTSVAAAKTVKSISKLGSVFNVLKSGAKKVTDLASKLQGVAIVGTVAFGVMRSGAEAASELAAESVAASAIMENLPFSIDKAAAATGGLVSNLDLATLAVNASRLKLTESAPEFANFAEAAAKLGRSAGITAKEGIESLVAGLGRGSTEMLDNLGIVLKAEEAQRVYAESLGRTASQLSATEKADAFRAVGMQRVIEAAEGVTLTTDGAAAAVQRFGIELDNIKTSALAGDGATRTLDEALHRIALTTKIQGKGVREYRSDLFDLRDALRDAGVSVDALDVSQTELGDALDQARVRRRSDIKDRLLEGEATEKLRDEMIALLEVDFNVSNIERELFNKRIESIDAAVAGETVRRTAIEEELGFLEENIAFLQGSGQEQARMNEMVAEEVELRAQILDIEGKTEAAAKLRRQQQLSGIREAGKEFSGRGRGRGGQSRRSKLAEAELDHSIDVARREMQLLDLRGKANTAFTNARLAQITTISDAELELARFQLERAKGAADRLKALGVIEDLEHSEFMTREQAKQSIRDRIHDDNVRSAKVTEERIAGERELGLAEAEIEANRALRRADLIEDPIERMDRETSARLALIDVQMKAANDPIDAMMLADSREAEIHEHKMARLEEAMRQEEETQRRRAEIIGKSTSIIEGFSGAAITAAFAQEGSMRAALAGEAKAMSARHAMIAVSEGLKAGVAFSSFNPIAGQAHLANMGANAAFAAGLGGIAGLAGGFRTAGAKVSGDPIGAGQFGGGGAGPGARGGPSGSGSSSSGSEIPNSPAQNTGGSSSSSGGTLTIIVEGDVIGQTSKGFIRSIDRGLRDLNFTNGRLAS